MSISSSVNGFLDLPTRPAKPREIGITHVMDKGLSLTQIEGLIATAGDYVDIVKLGWGTSYVTQNLREKLALYRSLGIPVICGGTLLEIAEVRGKLDGYRSWLSENGFESVEVSDGTIDLARERKLEIIETLARDFRVLSEVGSKDAEAIFAPYQWVEWIREELAAGAWKVITEARESGTAGIFRGSGEVRSGLIDEIVHELPVERLLFEAPQKSQQAWFIRQFGPDVNLGNIPPDEVVPLETLRLGLRSDTMSALLLDVKLIDLHCHSSASDGLLTPTALIEHAHALGLRTLALTDHDTLGGLGEAAAAERLGLRFVPGSELSVRPPSGSMHLLAYLPSADAEPLATRIREIGDYRADRNQRIVARLNELGYATDWEDVARRARGRVGRPHIAAALVEAGHVASVQEAFDRLLADGQPAYVDAGSLGPEDAVELVAASGGAPVLAHPYSLRLGDAALERFVARLARHGLRGLECFRPDHDDEQRAFTSRLSAQLGLVPTGGSDWHGTPDGPDLGDSGPVPVPDDTLERLDLA